ncbi:Hypothetical protein R9X50_00363600 [Acrodontium crateriforme]|uniref:Major facilitator superfamily (MFS) profile domain-containing protein n=1 Tax=Acrodontium crateriforme TaxID=150365 RepID=A0AAQ3M6J7_9PEZI|nr:Hypothetical protein R9X50_00363600 [Acrodontium crateriforme]
MDADVDEPGPSRSLLRPDLTVPPRTTADVKMTRLGMLRAYWLGLVVCIGGFLFGYDSGIIGGVLTLKSYQTDFRYGSKQQAHVSSLGVGLQSLGAFVACFFVWPLTYKLGRRIAIGICAFIFVIGVLIQTINTHSLTAFYLGRLIAGLGLGGSSVVVPMYSSEMTPKQIRGQVGSFYQLMFTLGIFTSYWTDWGVNRNIASISKQWQIPIGMQMLFAGLLGLGMLTLKESTRWLTSKGRHEEAWESLKWIRADDGPDAQAEMEEIRAGVMAEAHAREGFHIKEMINKTNLRRTLTGSAVFIAQQATGATAFAVFGPQYFGLLVGKSGTEKNLLLTAIFGAVKFVACLTFVILVADNIPRRYILTGGAIFMSACQLTTAAVVKTHPAPDKPHTTPSGIATVALIYLFVIAYNFSWGPLPWPYVAEIFPTRTREPGIAIGVASQWLFNFVFSISTPYMIKNMGWGTFLLWGLFDLAIALFSWLVLDETKGRSLEEIIHGQEVLHLKKDSLDQDEIEHGDARDQKTLGGDLD